MLAIKLLDRTGLYMAVKWDSPVGQMFKIYYGAYRM